MVMDLANTSGKKPLTGWLVWVSLKPSPDEVEELARRFPEVVELLEEEVRKATEERMAKGLIASPSTGKSLQRQQRVSSGNMLA